MRLLLVFERHLVCHTTSFGGKLVNNRIYDWGTIVTLPYLTFRIFPLLVVIRSTSGCDAVRWLETAGSHLHLKIRKNDQAMLPGELGLDRRETAL